MIKNNIRTQQVNWQNARDALSAIREQVFIKEQNVPPDLEWDELDATCIHIIAFDSANQPIGTARMLANGHIGRMAVLTHARHQGVGTKLLEHLIELAKQMDLPQVFLHAQTHAMGFYAKQGFEPVGEEFFEANIPHRKMERLLAN